MRTPTPIPAKRKAELEAFRKDKWSGDEFRRFQCIWLREEGELDTATIGKVLGWHVNTVRFTQQDFIKRGVEALVEGRRGGRNRAYLTPSEEVEFLDGYAEEAGAGTVLVVTEIHTALEKHLGKTIAPSTTYRMLKRHGWRKVVPRPFHPKRDPEAAEAFKKGAMRKPSDKPRPGRKPKGSSSG